MTTAESSLETIALPNLVRAIELALRLGDPGAAWRAAHALRRAFPEAIAPQVWLGQALLDAGNAAVAVDYFRRALRLNPLDAVAWAGLAGALARTGQEKAAAAALSRAALHDPLGSAALAPGIAPEQSSAGKGVEYLRRGLAEVAVAELAAALARSPRRDDLRLYYIEALRRSGDLAGARQAFVQRTLPDAGHLPALLVRAALYEYDTAAQRRCADYDPDGRLTRRFFAPDSPPWMLSPPLAVHWSEEFDPLLPYLDASAAQRVPPATSNDHTHVTQPMVAPKRLPETSARQTPATEADHRQDPAPHSSVAHHHCIEQPESAVDPEIKNFIAVAERVRQRLIDDSRAAPRPLVPYVDGRTFTQVVLSSRAALQQRFGADGFAAVDRRLQQYATVLQRRGVMVHICYCDDASSLHLDEGIAAAPAPAEPGALRDLLRTLSGALSERGRTLGAALLIGGDEIVPFHRLPNPLPDDDIVVLSDNPYATDDPAYIVPQRMVARLPDGNTNDPSLLFAQLDRLTAYHYGSRPQSSRSQRSFGRSPVRNVPELDVLSAGYCAEIWKEASRAVLDALTPDAPLTSSPPHLAENLDLRALRDRRLLYFNLHGAAGLPNFYGQPDAVWPGAATRLPVALRPDQIDAAAADGVLFLSEACYGAELTGRTVDTSIPLRALAHGALAFVGATVNAYGALTDPLIGADLLFQHMMKHLARGEPIGRALHQARLEFAQEMYRRQGFLDDVDIKTLIEFVLFGDPWGALYDADVEPKPWNADRTIVALERMPKPRARVVLDETEAPRDALQRARAVLRRVLPHGAALPLRITAQLNPRRQRKSDPERDLIFSARDHVPTIDGQYVAHTAHVTISGQAVVKVALTR
ncbi:tetratricopeptide repeat protein [Roseiflexus sp.]|uniref:tetratricopeptide repeat protein n=1 Tax=Roseiflexus sp. TaxID=2562120 RepID=UPI00398B276D